MKDHYLVMIETIMKMIMDVRIMMIIAMIMNVLVTGRRS